MATYSELFDLRSSSTLTALRKRILVSTLIKAQAIAEEQTPSQTKKEWAKHALSDPQHYETIILHYILSDNSSATVAQIENASDSLVQTAVNSAVDALLGS